MGLMGEERADCFVLLNLSSWCLVMVERLFPAVPRSCLRFVIVVFPDHTHLLFLVVVRSINPSRHFQPEIFSSRADYGGGQVADEGQSLQRALVEYRYCIIEFEL